MLHSPRPHTIHALRVVLGCLIVVGFIVGLMSYSSPLEQHLAGLGKRLVPMHAQPAAAPSAGANQPTAEPAPAPDFFTVDIEPIPTGETARGTAFPLSNGLWLTARHVVGDDCARIAMIIDGQTILAHIKYLDPNADLAVLQTDPVAVPSLPIVTKDPPDDASAFAFGFPKGTLGGTKDQLIGRTHMKLGGRLMGTAPVLSWAELDRSPESFESIQGISGGPMLDDNGNVVGIIVAASSRRGRNYTVAPEILRSMQSELGIQEPRPDEKPASDVVTAPVVLDTSAHEMSKNSRIALTYCIPEDLVPKFEGQP